jgi:hypothetical protein
MTTGTGIRTSPWWMPVHIQPYTGRECPYMAEKACRKCGWIEACVDDGV